MPEETQLADRLEITDLFARLARILDENRHADAHTIYADDVVVHSPRGGELHGIDEVTGFLQRTQAEDVHTQHVHGDVLVNIDGNQAEASANQLVHFYREGQPPHQSSGLRLNYTAKRTPKGWRFAEARLTLAWTTG